MSYNLKVRSAALHDASGIIGLFSAEKNNQYGWNIEKWKKYYIDYLEGRASSFIVCNETEIVAHSGVLSVRIVQPK